MATTPDQTDATTDATTETAAGTATETTTGAAQGPATASDERRDERSDDARSEGAPAEAGDDVLIELDPPAGLGPRGQDLLRGAVGGLIAGAVFIGLTSWFATSTGGGPADPFRQIASVALGIEPAQLATGGILVGAGIHVGLSLLFGLAFAVAVPLLRRHDALASVGIAYGGAIYIVNLLAFGQEPYPQLQATNQAFVLTAHLLFGALLATTFSGVRLPGESSRDVFGQRAARTVGGLSAAVVAFLHFALAGQSLDGETYVGALFIAGAIAMTYAAIQLTRRADLLAWVVGALTAVGMITGYVLARTTGLPGVAETGIAALDVVALAAEGAFVVAFVAAMVGRRRNRTRIRKVTRRRPTRADMSAKEAADTH